MLVCNKCKKTYPQGKRFCMYCGTFLEKKSGVAAVIGMFIVNCIPILGFPAAFIWSFLKYKSMKIKLIALTAVFVILNIFTTIFVYATTIELMKNRLACIAEQQNILINFDGQSPAKDNPGLNQLQIPGMGTDPMQSMPKTDASQEDFYQMMPGFFGTLPVHGVPGVTTGSDNNPLEYLEDIQIPGGDNLPKIDENGNMYYDTNGDGEYDIFIDKDGTIHMDSDGDGTYDMTYKPESGMP